MDVLTPKGRETLKQEKEAIRLFMESFRGFEFIETPKDKPADIDGFIVKENTVLSGVEVKCRYMTSDVLVNKYKNQWLITSDKLDRGVRVCESLGIDFRGFLYLVPDKMLLIDSADYSAKDLSRATFVPPYLVGVSTGSYAYTNATQSRIDLWTFGCLPFAKCIEETLSSDNVLPHGTKVRFDVDDVCISETYKLFATIQHRDISTWTSSLSGSITALNELSYYHRKPIPPALWLQRNSRFGKRRLGHTAALLSENAANLHRAVRKLIK